MKSIFLAMILIMSSSISFARGTVSEGEVPVFANCLANEASQKPFLLLLGVYAPTEESPDYPSDWSCEMHGFITLNTETNAGLN